MSEGTNPPFGAGSVPRERQAEALESRARELARAAHAGQEYSGGDFFTNHLARVVATLERFGEASPLLRAAAWLHDVVEDTDVTVAELRAELGDELATLVWRLTDAEGATRRERQTHTHAKIREDARAVRVKLADRIANVESARERGSQLMGMYRKEYPQFRRELFRRGEYDVMWAALEGALRDPAPSASP
jgi:(p)ppGpp synthase/HD superfamily hydrolase